MYPVLKVPGILMPMLNSLHENLQCHFNFKKPVGLEISTGIPLNTLSPHSGRLPQVQILHFPPGNQTVTVPCLKRLLCKVGISNQPDGRRVYQVCKQVNLQAGVSSAFPLICSQLTVSPHINPPPIRSPA